MPTTRFHLIRHAQSQANLAPHLVAGRSPHTPLSAQGRQAATAHGQTLTHLHPDALYAAPTQRTQQTAELIAAAAHWPLEIHPAPGLVEMAQGVAEGSPRARWWTPQALEARRSDPLQHRLAPDAENHADVRERALTALQTLHTRHPDQEVVVITHAMVMRNLLWHASGQPYRYLEALDIPNLGRAILDATNDQITLVELTDCIQRATIARTKTSA